MEGIHQIGDQLFITRKPTKIHEKVAFFPKKQGLCVWRKVLEIFAKTDGLEPMVALCFYC
jgi:hypothetical protein